MKRLIAVLILLSALGVSAETPREGATAVLNLLTARNYTELFTTRYTEWYKVQSEGVEPEEAVKKLSSRWERNYDQMVALFTALSTADFEQSKSELPQQTETGDVATGSVELGGQQIPYSLYQMKNGLWGFHL